MPGCKRDDQIAMKPRQWTPRDDQTIIRRARECCDGAFNRAGITDVDRSQLDAQRWCHGLDGGELSWSGGQGRIAKHCRPRHTRREFFQQLQPFRARLYS